MSHISDDSRLAFLDELDKVASRNVRLRRMAAEGMIVDKARNLYVTLRQNATRNGHIAGWGPIVGETGKAYRELGEVAKRDASQALNLASKITHLPPPKPLVQSKPLATMARILQFPKRKTAGMNDVIGYAGQRAASLGRGLAGVSKNVGNTIGGFATPVESLKKGWEASWRPGGKPLNPLMKGLMAYGAYNDVKQVAPKVDPMGQGRSRLHRGLAAVGNQVGGFIGAPHGLSGGIAGGMVGAKMGDLAGRAIDKVRGYKRTPQPPHLPPRPVGQQE